MFRKDWILIALIVCILALMIVPLAPTTIDVLITVNITLSIMLLMVGVYIRNPADFSTFPSVILIGTAFRLSLSIGTTRLILTEAEGGDIIQTFGDFVVGGSIAVGLVIFLIITVVQFLVVTKGAERVAEVAARFALDAMPGKQMTIDAEVKAGTITSEEGDVRRRMLNKESQFFGAMDGAMKFIKGDAVAGLIIIVINLIGGMIVGVMLHGMSFSASARLFTLLTVGDGLVAQIPALLMALCAGVVVTRATGPENADLGTDISRELLADPRVPAVASVLVFLMGMVPGFPIFIFSGAAVCLALTALAMAGKRRLALAQAQSAEETESTAGPEEAAVPKQLNHRFEVWLGADLAERLGAAQLQAQIQVQFDQLNERTGVNFLAPSVRFAPELGAAAVRICLDDVPLVTADLPFDRAFSDQPMEKLRDAGVGQATPLNLVVWTGCHYPAAQSTIAIAAGHDPIDPSDLLVTGVFRLFERNLAQLFGQKEFETLLASLNAVEASVMADVLQSTSQPVLYRVFRALVSDGVPLRPAQLVVESLHYWTQMPEVAGPQFLEDCLRGSLKRQMCHALADRDGILGVVLIDPDYEDWLRKQGLDGRKGAPGDGIMLPAEWVEPTLSQFRNIVLERCAKGRTVAVVVAADLRRYLRGFLASNDIQLPVLAPHELAGETRSFPLLVLRKPSRSGAQPMGSLQGRAT